MSPIRLNDADTPPTVQPTPSTPAPFRSRKQTRSVPQSPMFMNVMQKAIDKTSREHSEQVTPRVSRVETSAAAKSLSAPKGKSLLNPSKGKSLVLPSLDEQAESSDNDWEDVVEEKKKRSTLVDLIMEAAHDVRRILSLLILTVMIVRFIYSRRRISRIVDEKSSKFHWRSDLERINYFKPKSRSERRR